ncbi:MAG: glycerophosphodiester phosphodiesterase family protein [Clostridiaceae bacterium]|nr:glycerophosphodiester phosphodiesterase family protein [Clostridiaceae bacterium]
MPGFDKRRYDFADILHMGIADPRLEGNTYTIPPGETLTLPLDPVGYGETVLVNAVAAVDTGDFGGAYCNLRLYRGHERLVFPVDAEAPDALGACQFYGAGARDYRFRFIIPRFADRAVLTIWTTDDAGLRLDYLQVSVSDETPAPLPFGTGVKFVAHLGMIGFAPCNTLPAFALARRAGYRECVTNTNVTRDGVLVALHNDTIDATANGQGSVYEMTFDELRRYDFGVRFHPLYAGTPIPSLEEVLSLMAHSGLRPVLRLSSNFVGDKHFALENLWELVRKLGLSGHCTAKGFSREVLSDLSMLAGSRLRYGFCCSGFTREDCLWLRTLGSDVYFDVQYRYITPELVTLAQEYDIPVEAWIINDFQKIVELADLGVTGFTTDYYPLDGCIF